MKYLLFYITIIFNITKYVMASFAGYSGNVENVLRYQHRWLDGYLIWESWLIKFLYLTPYITLFYSIHDGIENSSFNYLIMLPFYSFSALVIALSILRSVEYIDPRIIG